MSKQHVVLEENALKKKLKWPSTSQSVRSGTGKKFLNVVSWLQMMLMDDTKHTEKSV